MTRPGECDRRVRSLLEVVYDFSDAEIETLLLLCRAGEARVAELSTLAGKDRSTVQRLLTRLTSTGLICRESTASRFLFRYESSVA